MKPFTYTMHLQTYVRGLYVVQPKPDIDEFSRLIEASGAFWPSLCDDYRKDYERLMDHAKAFCAFVNTQTAWLIVIFGEDKRTVLMRAVHETVHLADRFTDDRENRARFVEHVYITFADEVERQLNGSA
jgi:hypothetical protein